MAKETIVRLTDDIEGGEAVETLTFSLRGVEYEIDLSEKNVAALEKIFERYTKAGQRVVPYRAARGSGQGRNKRPRGTSSPSGEAAAIREWAIASGYAVSSRGRISAEVRAAYEAAP
jgi:Lsr2